MISKWQKKLDFSNFSTLRNVQRPQDLVINLFQPQELK